MTSDDVTRWLGQARDGDDEAAQELWDAYVDKLLRYAKRKLANMPRRAIDEEDVVLSAMNSFFAGARSGTLDPKNRNELWKLLATITVRKATAELRRHYAEKRGGGDVRGESIFADFAMPDQSSIGIDQIMNDVNLQPMSGLLAQTYEERFSQLDDDALRAVAQLRLEGYSNDEMAEQLQCSRATIKRRLARIREQWSD